MPRLGDVSRILNAESETPLGVGTLLLDEPSLRNGIQITGSTFHVVHRSRAYGPFDYEWSKDFCGVEFLYSGQKFGEYCSADEVYADLKEFRLPKRVYEVASISIATLVKSIFDGVPESERAELLVAQLTEMGLSRYAVVEPLNEAA